MKNYLILFSILIIALFVRFYNFSNRITFGPEQARSLMVSANYIQDKPSLLGQEYFRANSLGHKLFTSALFNYTLVPLLLTTNYDPYLITIYFALLNVFTGYVIYVLCRKMFGKEISIIFSILFLFNSYMIYHSMFIWVLNYLPLLGILTIYYIWKILKKKIKPIEYLYLGIISGIGFGLEYLYVLIILIVLFFVIKYSKAKLKSLALFVIGGAIGDFPQVLFDLKHNFYHLSSLWQYALDTFKGSSDAGFTYYHFLGFWPILLLSLSFVIFYAYKKNKVVGILMIILYLILNLKSSFINFNKPVGMEDGLKYNDLKTASKLIADRAGDNFNLVTLYDFDTRAYTFRYFVQYVYGKKPLNDISYKEPKVVFALAATNYDFENDNPWELNQFKPYNIARMTKVGEGYELFRLYK
jgi:hypothetical protein